MKTLQILCAALLLLLGRSEPAAADTQNVILALKQGGYVLIFRHGATDDGQKDIYPFNFDDMKAQRQLSDKGRETARQIGASLKKFNVPVGAVYTSRLNRAIETGKLISGQDVKPVRRATRQAPSWPSAPRCRTRASRARRSAAVGRTRSGSGGACSRPGRRGLRLRIEWIWPFDICRPHQSGGLGCPSQLTVFRA